ncbi:MAG: 4-phosphopantetheinyl transferase [Micromonosporaceae bacterium]|nr:4-phosphopantetheinyl transferase [Micromonosporaceae bacterium]
MRPGEEAGGSAIQAECAVWWADLSMLRDRHLNLLDALESDRRRAYRREADADRFTIGAVLLRLALAAELGAEPDRVPIQRSCPTCARPHGRPTVAGAGRHLTVSHSGNRIAVAITATAPVGVDVEELASSRPVDDSEQLARHVLGPGESVGDRREFLVYWVRKESVVKATGEGLRAPLPDVLVSRPDAPPRLVGYPGRRALAATMADLDPGDGYLGALTVLADVPLVVREHDAAGLLLG